MSSPLPIPQSLLWEYSFFQYQLWYVNVLAIESMGVGMLTTESAGWRGTAEVEKGSGEREVLVRTKEDW